MCLEQSLVKHCSPTLAGIKVASLYRFLADDRAAFAREYKGLRERLRAYGLELRILKGCSKTSSYLLYLYRKKELEALLGSAGIAEYLRGVGYGPGDCACCRNALCRLVRRLGAQGAFPHEIGLFLGYPLEDVRGFVENGGRNYTCRGLWKVYGDPQAAAKKFSSYRLCTVDYQRRYAAGTPLPKLIVAA